MHHSVRVCLILCLALSSWAAGHDGTFAAEGFHPEGFDARRIETDKRASDERKSEEKREDSEAWFKKAVEGKDLTHESKAEFHDANQLLKETDRLNKGGVSEPKKESRIDADADQLLRKIEAPEAKANPRAADIYKENPSQLKGKDAIELESELDKRLVKDGKWQKMPMRDSNGVRYIDGKGGSIEINKGYPEGLKESSAGDDVHRGPYVKISGGSIDRIPLKGNPAAN